MISGYREGLDWYGQTVHSNAATLTNVDLCHVIYECDSVKFDAV